MICLAVRVRLVIALPPTEWLRTRSGQTACTSEAAAASTNEPIWLVSHWIGSDDHARYRASCARANRTRMRLQGAVALSATHLPYSLHTFRVT